LTTKNTIFILTYCEGDFFTTKAWANVDHSNYNFIVLDNGNQQTVKDFCEANNWEYYASEYNIGSSAGYNWIFRAASMLKLKRAALVQSDVEIQNIETIDMLFNTNVEKCDDTSILMWPQTGPKNWLDELTAGTARDFKFGEGSPVNLGQIFSFNPDHMIYNNLLVDENFVVTHFDDVDLKYRIINTDTRILNLAWYHKMGDRWVPDGDHPDVTNGDIPGMYKIHHISVVVNNNHEDWYEYNIGYYETKQLHKPEAHKKLNLWPQASLRWTALGYPPFPVEYELNRWWSQRESK
jgi:hypothetical protein